MEKVAILGLGIVGSRVRERIVEAGYPVTCWSRTRRGLEGEKESPEDALEGAELVSVYLKDAPMVREVFERAKVGLTKGAIVLNHSTIDLATTLWLAEQCAAKGCDFEPHFTMANMWKDSRYALALAESAGVHLPAITAVSARMGEMCAEGSGELDFSALAKAYD